MLFACGAKMFFNRVVAPRFLGREGDLSAAETAERDELPPLLDYLEGVIPASGYLVGDRLTLADISVAGPFANSAIATWQSTRPAIPKITAYVASDPRRGRASPNMSSAKPPILAQEPTPNKRAALPIGGAAQVSDQMMLLFAFGCALAVLGEVLVLDQLAAACRLSPWEPTKPLSASPLFLRL